MHYWASLHRIHGDFKLFFENILIYVGFLVIPKSIPYEKNRAVSLTKHKAILIGSSHMHLVYGTNTNLVA